MLRIPAAIGITTAITASAVSISPAITASAVSIATALIATNAPIIPSVDPRNGDRDRGRLGPRRPTRPPAVR